MKTFDDLIFEPHPIAGCGIDKCKDCKRAVMNFDNGYGVSVIFGEVFYSNGIDTYELAVLLKGRIYYPHEIGNDVLAYISKDEVTEAMMKIQLLK